MQSKKAAVELQFHWIYVMLIGAALLIFFGVAIYQYQKISKEKNERQTLTAIDSAIRNVYAHPGLSQTVAGRIDFTRDCETNSLRIGTAGKSSPFPIFSSERIKGTNITLSTLPWNTGFRASNFLLISTDETVFLIHHDSGNQESIELYEKVLKIWPTNLPYETESDNARSSGAKTVRVLALNTDFSEQFTGKELNVVRVDATAETGFEQGILLIKDLQNTGGVQKNYIGLSAALAALFTDAAGYQCGMDHAYTHLAYVAGVYESKTQQLIENPNFEHCDVHYVLSRDALTQIGIEAGRQDARNIFLQIEGEGTNERQGALTYENDNLLRKSCPVIY